MGIYLIKMFGFGIIRNNYYPLILISLFPFTNTFPSNFLNFTDFTDPNFPRQFVQQPLAPPPSGETTNPERPTNINTPPPFLNNNNNQQGNTGGGIPFPYPQRPTIPDAGEDGSTTTTEYYSTLTTESSTTEFTSTTTEFTTTDFLTTTEENYDSTSTTESNNEDSSQEDSSEDPDDSTTTITPFINPDLPGFPVNPPIFPILPTAGGQQPKPSISSTLLSNYPTQHVDGAVGPFPEKIQEQGSGGSLVAIGGSVGQLLQRLNPLNLLRPVTNTFQNIGHVLSHPNYGPGAAILRPVQFWSAVNAAGNPSLAPFRKLPSSDVIVITDSRKNAAGA